MCRDVYIRLPGRERERKIRRTIKRARDSARRNKFNYARSCSYIYAFVNYEFVWVAVVGLFFDSHIITEKMLIYIETKSSRRNKRHIYLEILQIPA